MPSLHLSNVENRAYDWGCGVEGLSITHFKFIDRKQRMGWINCGGANVSNFSATADIKLSPQVTKIHEVVGSAHWVNIILENFRSAVTGPVDAAPSQVCYRCNLDDTILREILHDLHVRRIKEGCHQILRQEHSTRSVTTHSNNTTPDSRKPKMNGSIPTKVLLHLSKQVDESCGVTRSMHAIYVSIRMPLGRCQ
ncbi:hypothetical protein PHMEG_0005373 [Phytophthora megakarya]|uniref:Uncharacterized protein n=1 Tax=Phytophthora megakarya TaxID=4795 RepID=A0A225WT23_9STRA|nr:hypothetical protein PHMEG_0005373 [Phytophthora megakarya]